MSGILRLLGMSILSVGACLFAFTADAATGRADSANVRSTTIGGGSVAARMPSMPTLPMIAVGNISTNVPSGNTNTGGNNGGGNNGGGNNGGGDNGGGSQGSECPDGGVKNSEYTIDNCMRDVLACINNGGLPNGLNDMFNEDLRASIINGMGLCYAQVDKCLTNVRRNCKPVYITRADVWIDFNSRKVQPEYYSFVLRKTGLTPTQAENTCLLLDRNVYGKSFAAVSANGVVTGEYNKGVGAYNGQSEGTLSKGNPKGSNVNTKQFDGTYELADGTLSEDKLNGPNVNTNGDVLGRNIFAGVSADDLVTGEYKQWGGAYEQVNGTLSKDNPMGPNVNTNGNVDAKRGHYARWDASNAQCLIRVAAYNKDKLITNEWLFGTIGDKQPAEVWKVAGETFTCNKDLFGFSLKKDTATVALLGVGGGTVLGATAGAISGAVIANHNINVNVCADKEYRYDLLSKIKKSKYTGILENYLDLVDTSSNGQKNKKKSDKNFTFQATTDLPIYICNQLIQLPDVYAEYDARVAVCEKALANADPSLQNPEVAYAESFKITCQDDETLNACLNRVIGDVPNGHLQYYAKLAKKSDEQAKADAVSIMESGNCLVKQEGTNVYKPKNTAACAAVREIMLVAGLTPLAIGQCVFKAIDKTSVDPNRNIACTAGNTCILFTEVRRQLDQLQSVLSAIEIKPEQSRSTTIGKATGIGAAVGAGAGGIATAITALVESDNINCRVGDGLGQVGLNKSYSIDGLKDLYVKWNLNLPDTQVLGASGAVTDEASWKDACDDYVAEENCEEAQFYYKNASGALEWIYSACTWDSETNGCNPNNTLLKSYGVIE